MKKYVCHKEVEAARILAHSPGLSPWVDVGELRDAERIVIPLELSGRLSASGWSTDGAYLVRYADGYLSFSPRKAFEEGYTELGAAHELAVNEVLEQVDFAVPVPVRERWEYQLVSINAGTWAALGLAGWEMVGMMRPGSVAFKRRLP